MAERFTNVLWFNDGEARAAAEFYASVFPDSHVGEVMSTPSRASDKAERDELTVNFTVLGVPFMGLNGDSNFKANESVSFMIATNDQEETDRYWNAIISNGGTEGDCGWCKDRWGFSWQITPRQLTEGIKDPDPTVARRVFEAMMTMKKIDIAKVEAARRGD